MAGKRIFLTGCSGLVGNRCLIHALSQGYNVIASVRSADKAEKVRKGITAAVGSHLDNLAFVIIPDMSIEDCFDNYMSEVDYIVHVASPLWTVTDTSDPERAHIQPAVNGTLSILSAAKKAKTVAKVVLCSSLAALTTNEKCFGDNIDNVTYTAESRVPDSHYQPMKSQAATVEYYFAGKTLSLNATDRLVKEGLPFDVINIFPSTVLGRFELARSTEELLASSNTRGLAMALGQTLPPIPTSCVHVDDLAKMHIDILKMKTGKLHFPSAVVQGLFPCNGNIPDREFQFDSSETERFFGWKFRSFEEMVRDVATQYLELNPNSAS